MKPLIKRKYLATWYVNVKNIDPSQIHRYIDAFKQSLSRGASSPWHELEVFLEAPVLGYFIPTEDFDTRLEVQEIRFRVENYDEETSKDTGNTL